MLNMVPGSGVKLYMYIQDRCTVIALIQSIILPIQFDYYGQKTDLNY